MPRETVTVDQFRNIFGDVPELTQPAVFRDLQGHDIIVAFGKPEMQDHGYNYYTGILETPSYNDPEADADLEPGVPRNSCFVRVRYDSHYRLRARAKEIWLKTFGESGERDSETLLMGDIRYDAGPVSIVFNVAPQTVLHAYDFMLKDPSSYLVTVAIESASSDPEKPPLAQVGYNWAGHKIPINTDFVDAGFEDALQGRIEQRHDILDRLNTQSTYFQWEYLVGAKVGITRFKDGQSGELESDRWLTQINAPQLTSLKDSPYQAGIYHSRERWLNRERLSFVRTNALTEELWILSAPDWIMTTEFIRNLSGSLFRDFFSEYPVVFGVRRTGQEDLWFKTPGNNEREKAILDALSRPRLLPTQT